MKGINGVNDENDKNSVVRSLLRDSIDTGYRKKSLSFFGNNGINRT